MSELGVIGQLYEDRRTKKQGKLVERDTKFKTFLMESPDGKPFNISYGGFKSNWRKVEEEVPSEESFEEIPVAEPVVDAEEVEPKKKSAIVANEALKLNFFGEFLKKCVDMFDGINDVVVKPTPNKGKLCVKLHDRKIFETYSKYKKGLHNTLISETTMNACPELLNFCEQHGFRETSINSNNICLHIVPERVDAFLGIIKNFILSQLEREALAKEDS